VGKAIKCTITGLELGLKKEATFYYVGRIRPGEIALIGIVLDDIKKDDEGPFAVVFDTIKEATWVLRTIKSAMDAHDPSSNIYWAINRLIPEYQKTNNRIKLKTKTRSIGS